MINKTVQKALNDQIQMEFASAYAYLSMSAYLEAESLFGAAHWMRLQYGEELSHALKIFDFVNDRNGRVTLQAIEQPLAEYRSVLDVFEKALAHEQKVSASIHQLYELAMKEGDHPTEVMLQWFINEQVEEEKNATDIIAQLKMVGESSEYLLMLDKELGVRQPAAE